MSVRGEGGSLPLLHCPVGDGGLGAPPSAPGPQRVLYRGWGEMDISWCWKAASCSLQGRDLGATRNQGYQDLSPTGHRALPSHLEPNVSSWWDVPSVRRRRGGETKAHLLGVSLCPKVRVECGRRLPLVAALGSRICPQKACCLLHPSRTPSLLPLGLWAS